MQNWQISRTCPGAKQSGEPLRESVGAICLQIVDASLLGVIYVAPLFFGGRDPLGRLIFILFSCLAGFAWFLHQSLQSGPVRWTKSPASLICLASIALVAAQLLPLLPNWLEAFAPRNASLLPLWTANPKDATNLGAWNTLSLAPENTKLALATLIAYWMLFVATVGRLQRTADIQRLMKWIALSAIGMSLFGLIQYFTSNGRFFWFYEYPYSSTLFPAKGSFTTSNHFAHFLVLGLAPLMAWIVLRLHGCVKERGLPSTSKRTTLLLFLGVVVLVFAVLLSVSRGGALALAACSAVLIAIYYRHGLVSHGYVLGLVTIGVFVVGLLSINGYDLVARRLDDFAGGSLEDLDHNAGRRRIWAANLEAFRQGGLFGSGAGSHREIYPVYLTDPAEVEYTHAENGYIQIATENGVLGVALLALALSIVGYWMWRTSCTAKTKEHRILAGAITASLVASLVHSVVDFVWFIPACMSMAVMLLASLLRLSRLGADRDMHSIVWPKARWWASTAVVAITSAWAISVAVGPGTASINECRYRLLASAGKAKTLELLKATDAPQTQDREEQKLMTKSMLHQLHRILARDPNSAHTHVRLARKYLRHFEELQVDAENSMSLDQIRASVFANQFRSAKELRDWLQLAFGEHSQLLYRAHFHARRSLQLCPLMSDAYLALASLCFLEGKSTTSVGAYLAQAERLHPYDCDLLFEIGLQRIHLQEAAQLQLAEELWTRIFHYEGAHQLHIIHRLAGHSPAERFLTQFTPDWHTLPDIWNRYRHHGTAEDWKHLIQYGFAVAKRDCPNETPYGAARIWHALADMQRKTGDHEGMLISYQQAYQVAPNIYWVRREYGRALVRAGYFQEAEPHLRWCQARHPEDEKLESELILATKSRLRQTVVPAQAATYQ